jgi:hypothetical protein
MIQVHITAELLADEYGPHEIYTGRFILTLRRNRNRVETVTACSIREEMRSGISIMRPRIVSSGLRCLSLVCC